MEKQHFDNEHQSPALLVGVAVDKMPALPISFVPRYPLGPTSHTSTILIQLGEGHSEMVEVQYITDTSQDFNVDNRESTILIHPLPIDDRSGMENLLKDQRIGKICHAPDDLGVDHSRIQAINSEEQMEVVAEGISGVGVHLNDITTISPESSSDKFKKMTSERDTNNSNPMSLEGIGEKARKCFLCQSNARGTKDLFCEDMKKIMLPELLNRYMSISIFAKYDGKTDYPLCEECVNMILRWHDVSLKYQEHKSIQNAASSTADLNEDEKNSQDDLPNTSDKNTNSKKSIRGKYQKRIETHKCRYALLQSQVKNVVFNSAFHYFMKRELTEDDWEYIAERIHSTKSKSSVKIREIENLTFSKDKLVSIFCNDCRKSIAGGKDGYYSHRKMFHNDLEDFLLPCDICGNFYPEKDSTGLSGNYFPHWINHFYFEECQECKEKFPNLPVLKTHMAIHRQKSGFPCPKCDKVLAKKITLEQHLKTHLSKQEKKKHSLICHICGKIIFAPTLKAHIFSVHSDERPWKCEVCGSKFKHKSDLGMHRNAVHLKIKNFNCNVCGKSFSHHYGLRTHLLKHENRREHGCPTCDKKFITQRHLKKHVVTHKEVKDIMCSVCDKGFKKIEALQEHMTIHTGEIPYECHICGRRVRVLSNLYKHHLVHKRNKTYYSKKDGLPDPLDAYILEQQKKKQVNKIVEENANRRGLSEAKKFKTVVAKPEDILDKGIDSIVDLTVNRSKGVTRTYNFTRAVPPPRPQPGLANQTKREMKK